MIDNNSSAPKPDVDSTEKTGWEHHAKEQRRVWLDTTPAERIAWLEDAMRFANQHKKLLPWSVAANGEFAWETF